MCRPLEASDIAGLGLLLECARLLPQSTPGHAELRAAALNSCWGLSEADKGMHDALLGMGAAQIVASACSSTRAALPHAAAAGVGSRPPDGMQLAGGGYLGHLMRSESGCTALGGERPAAQLLSKLVRDCVQNCAPEEINLPLLSAVLPALVSLTAHRQGVQACCTPELVQGLLSTVQQEHRAYGCLAARLTAQVVVLPPPTQAQVVASTTQRSRPSATQQRGDCQLQQQVVSPAAAPMAGGLPRLALPPETLAAPLATLQQGLGQRWLKAATHTAQDHHHHQAAACTRQVAGHGLLALQVLCALAVQPQGARLICHLGLRGLIQIAQDSPDAARAAAAGKLLHLISDEPSNRRGMLRRTELQLKAAQLLEAAGLAKPVILLPRQAAQPTRSSGSELTLALSSAGHEAGSTGPDTPCCMLVGGRARVSRLQLAANAAVLAANMCSSSRGTPRNMTSEEHRAGVLLSRATARMPRSLNGAPCADNDSVTAAAAQQEQGVTAGGSTVTADMDTSSGFGSGVASELVAAVAGIGSTAARQQGQAAWKHSGEQGVGLREAFLNWLSDELPEAAGSTPRPALADAAGSQGCAGGSNGGGSAVTAGTGAARLHAVAPAAGRQQQQQQHATRQQAAQAHAAELQQQRKAQLESFLEARAAQGKVLRSQLACSLRAPTHSLWAPRHPEQQLSSSTSPQPTSPKQRPVSAPPAQQRRQRPATTGGRSSTSGRTRPGSASIAAHNAHRNAAGGCIHCSSSSSSAKTLNCVRQGACCTVGLADASTAAPPPPAVPWPLHLSLPDDLFAPSSTSADPEVDLLASPVWAVATLPQLRRLAWLPVPPAPPAPVTTTLRAVRDAAGALRLLSAPPRLRVLISRAVEEREHRRPAASVPPATHAGGTPLRAPQQKPVAGATGVTAKPAARAPRPVSAAGSRASRRPR